MHQNEWVIFCDICHQKLFLEKPYKSIGSSEPTYESRSDDWFKTHPNLVLWNVSITSILYTLLWDRFHLMYFHLTRLHLGWVQEIVFVVPYYVLNPDLPWILNITGLYFGFFSSECVSPGCSVDYSRRRGKYRRVVKISEKLREKKKVRILLRMEIV